MSKHTPGPWKYRSGGECYIISGHRTPIALVALNAESKGHSSLANARLIAKSPEMLELLKRAVSIIRQSTVKSTGRRTASQIDKLISEIERT